MRKFTSEELQQVLHDHAKWLESEGMYGNRADLHGSDLRGSDLRRCDLSGSDLRRCDLSGSDLSGSDLSGSNLRGGDLRWCNLSGSDLSGSDLCRCDLSGSDLRGSNLRGSDLRGSDLHGSDLRGSDLSGSDLSGSDLCRCDLSGSDLSGSNLSGSDLRGSDLSGSDLHGSDLRGSDLSGSDLSGDVGLFIPMACPSVGAFIAWKKCRDDLIVKLLIPDDARRLSAAGRKCRCNKAEVLGIQNLDGTNAGTTAYSTHDFNFAYVVGQTVTPDSFCDDRWQECSNGIHFFITREEAVSY